MCSAGWCYRRGAPDQCRYWYHRATADSLKQCTEEEHEEQQGQEEQKGDDFDRQHCAGGDEEQGDVASLQQLPQGPTKGSFHMKKIYPC